MPAKISTSPPAPRRRLSPADRERQIVEKAITIFTKHGFSTSTRDLARELGVTQPLLYRYFTTKDDLIERVYDEVFQRPWNEDWEVWLSDRSETLAVRLRRYFNDYAKFVTRKTYVRLFMFAGLTQTDLVHRYIETLRSSHFDTIARELRHEFDIAAPRTKQEENDEIELIWATHSSIFYMGVRRWIYEYAPPEDIAHSIKLLVDAFLLGVPAVLRAQRATPAAEADLPPAE